MASPTIQVRGFNALRYSNVFKGHHQDQRVQCGRCTGLVLAISRNSPLHQVPINITRQVRTLNICILHCPHLALGRSQFGISC